MCQMRPQPAGLQRGSGVLVPSLYPTRSPTASGPENPRERMMKQLLILLALLLVAAAPGLPTPDPYPGPTSYPAPATGTPAPTATETAGTSTPGATSTPVCNPGCLPTSVKILTTETRAETGEATMWLVLAAALLMAVCRWKGLRG